MASTTMTSTTSTNSNNYTSNPSSQSRPPLPKTPSAPRSLRRPSLTASTPNLNSAYASQSRLAPGAKPLGRKSSLAALPQSSLASIPDIYEDHNQASVLRDRSSSRNNIMAPMPTTPGRPTGDDVSVGDTVDVPGNMQGVVRFVGSVQGKKGTFAGVELHSDYAARGKNSGDVDGISYFTTSVAGAGIFLPITKAIRSRGSPSFPMTPSTSGFKNGSHTSNYTPPTPGLSKFSQSIGPGVRASSPAGKRAPRTSLPRPDSPVRRTQMTPGPRPFGTPAAKGPSRYGSPTNRFAQSVRGTAGDPSKRNLHLDHKPNMPGRSASALGFDDDATPLGLPRSKTTNGSVGSTGSFRARSPSRVNGASDQELERLRAQLEERDQQLRDQSATLLEMEGSLTELQSLMENAGDLGGNQNPEFDGKDTAQLRALLREKNEKISMLTSEFDAHRADFRSTIDALEMASTETERVYEKRMEELMTDIRELESRNLDVESVASQLKQLEELVQELEEGLEDARRGEAEARGEVEFLRGEVERTRTELRREREKAGSNSHTANSHSASQELEQKEDEIRGLKAIIHSLSRDSGGHEEPVRPRRPGSLIPGDVIEHKIARDNLERQVAELQSLLEQKGNREEELERELDGLRSGNNPHRSSLRDSRDTVVLARANETRSPEVGHKRGSGLGTMAESDVHSNATENSTLWCEICETGGHDILTCTNMFGPDGDKTNGDAHNDEQSHDNLQPRNEDAHPAPLSPVKSKSPLNTPTPKIMPNPMDHGPVAGKESGVMDPEKWCALCERDGHDSVDCPFEDAF